MGGVPRIRRGGQASVRLVRMALVAIPALAGLGIPRPALAQEGPSMATLLPRDTRLLRVMNPEQVERLHREALRTVQAGLAGASLVEVTIGPDGRVDDARLVRTSGSTPLDAEAVRIGRLARFSDVRQVRRPDWVRYQLIFQWKPVPPRTWPPRTPR